MEYNVEQAREKAITFWRQSFQFFGKEVSLESNQHFGIDEIIDKDEQAQTKHNYHIQYGFPSSGCVSMNFSYEEENESFSIDKINVYALPKDKEMIVAAFQPQAQVGEINISANFGVEMGTSEHTTLSAIAENPNAIRMLDIAIDDLAKAEVLGECRLEVPIGSTMIPCTNSSPKRQNIK